ncbi:MAG: hypothetical protein ACTS8R_06730 [Arsenophonus sp. NC-QC1-MAG3]
MLTRAPSSRSAKNSTFCQVISVKKVNPYLGPLYDALFEILDFEKAKKLIERAM